MKYAVALLAVAATCGSAVAQGRPSSTRMTCQGAAALVRSQGAVILGLGGDRFDRVVRDQGFCNRGEDTKPMFAPTADNPQCFVGYYCFEFPREPK